MWWKRFLECEGAISSLPHDSLTGMNTAASTQLAKMQDQENALQSKINDVSFEICALLATENQSTLMQNFADISVDEQRARQLKATYSSLLYERELCEHEILAQETIQEHLNVSDKSTDLPPQVRVVCGKLVEAAISASDLTVRDDCLMGLDLITGRMRLIPDMIEQNKTFFRRKCAELRSQLDGLIRKTALSVKKVYQLNSLLEDLVQKTDVAGPMLPKMKQQLKLELSQYGNTRRRLLDLKKEVDELKAKRDHEENECSALSADIMLRQADGGLSKEEMQEMVELKQKKMKLEIRQNELSQKRQLIESEIRGAKEETEDVQKGIKEVENQTSLLKSAIGEQKRRFALLEKAGVTLDNFDMVWQYAHGVNFSALEKSLEQKREHLKLMERRKKNVEEKGVKLLDQEEKIDAQIRSLSELLTAAQIPQE